MTEEFPKTEVELQREIGAAMGHARHAWSRTIQTGWTPGVTIWPPEPDDEHHNASILTASYHLAVMIGHLFRVQQGMSEMWGTTDGQLCPYDDCRHDLAIPQEAWYVCAHCKRAFYARACDGDFEDYHCEIPKEGAPMPVTAAVARDLGPSWGTPEGIAP